MNKLMLIEQDSAPMTPASGRVTLYADRTHKINVKDSTGATRQLGGTTTSVAAPDFFVGNPEVYSSESEFIIDELSAHPIRLVCTAQPTSLSLHIKSTTVLGGLGPGQIVMGVYNNITTDPTLGVHQYPGSLLCTTAAFSPVLGWNKVTITVPPTLTPETYHLVYHVQSNSYSTRTTSGTEGWFIQKVPATGGIAYTGVLPSTFPSPYNGDGVFEHRSFYATLSPV